MSQQQEINPHSPRATVSVDRDLRHQLKIQAAREGRSIKAILDELIDHYLKRKKAA